MDIELVAQFCALRAGHPARRVEAQLRAGVKAGVIDAPSEAQLLRAYRLCWTLQATGRLLADKISDIDQLGPAGQKFILTSTGTQTAHGLATGLQDSCATAHDLITSILAETGLLKDKTNHDARQ
jgi:glutamate-ammonia-ligase adenylyltransferase